MSRGLSLFETVLSFWIGSMIVLCFLRIMMSLWAGCESTLTEMEAEYSWSQIHRVLSADIHGAVQVGVLSGMLIVTEANGARYQYLVNPLGEFVRIQQGGGTSVIAAGVQFVHVHCASSIVSVSALMQYEGQPHQMTVSALQAYLP